MEDFLGNLPPGGGFPGGGGGGGGGRIRGTPVSIFSFDHNTTGLGNSFQYHDI